MPISIRQRSIDEVQPELKSPVQSPHGLIVGAALPLLSADSPGSISDLADFHSGTAKLSISHYHYDGMREPNLLLRNPISVMWRALFLTLLLSAAALAANVRLYMKDGTFHLVREYQKQPDRVRYYSVERGDWEEVPLDMVDLKRTESEVQTREAAMKEDAAAQDAEEKAIRAERREFERIPQETGAFWFKDDKVTVLKQAEMKVVNNKRRSILKAMSPIPIVSGKSTV